jgi:hypothetical protein
MSAKYMQDIFNNDDYMSANEMSNFNMNDELLLSKNCPIEQQYITLLNRQQQLELEASNLDENKLE